MTVVNPVIGHPFAALTPWDAKRQALACIGVHDEAPDVKTFTFAAAGCYFSYLPGQFVTLELPVAGGPVYRTYTIASSPSRPHALAVTVKAQAGSIGTRWMFENLVPGQSIRAAHGPLGHFTFVGQPAGKLLFVAAGSGITPMMSMLRYLADCAPLSDVAFLVSARRPEDIIFRAELELLATRMPHLALGFIAETRSPGHAWHGLTGRIDGPKLHALAADFRERTVFCCGPEPFMATVSTLLDASGFDMARYHQESFGSATIAATAEPHVQARDQAADAGFAIRFDFSGIEAACIAGETLLATARVAGVRIPAACESGLCGTCKVLKTAGTVEMNHNGGILDEEIEEGYVLACCSRPLSAVTIEA